MFQYLKESRMAILRYGISPYIHVDVSAWMDEAVMLSWVEQVLKPIVLER